MKLRINILLFFLAVSFLTTLFAQDYIVVNKHNVTYTFVSSDENTDGFIKFGFPTWEEETFEVFEQVKDSSGIAIDLGAWIGTTAIWLSKHFSHVIAVDADRLSIFWLEKNLKASHCYNVSICDKAVTAKNQYVIFGPRGDVLNQSISYIKEMFEKDTDYVVQAITFDRLINEYVYGNEALSSKKVSFIKCDIEGGEEGIIEDMLRFALAHNAKVYLSFHLDWWKTKSIDNLSMLFSLFKSNCPSENICEYIRQNPFTSILFEPL